ncbi:hypothetical protein ACV34O_31840, partial [Pseudomonas aeruginosa]
GAQVDHRGTVLAEMGGVGLGAGSDLTLNFAGNKLLDIRVDAGVANALASNGGLLKADGGRVLMAARTANALLNTVVNSQGAIEARSLRGKNGRIVLDGTLGVHHRVEQRIGGPGRHQDSPPVGLEQAAVACQRIGDPGVDADVEQLVAG